jgi:hypothetical protein
MVASRKWSRLMIFAAIAVLIIAIGLLPQIDPALAKYSPLGLIILGFILSVFRKQICIDIMSANEGAIVSFLRSFELKPQSLLFCGAAFFILGVLLLIKDVVLS